MITKIAVKTDNFRRKWINTISAREAWYKILLKYRSFHPEGKILLPAYIGWSPNEGSGIFDSVYNPFRGIEVIFRVINGEIKKNQKMQ